MLSLHLYMHAVLAIYDHLMAIARPGQMHILQKFNAYCAAVAEVSKTGKCDRY